MATGKQCSKCGEDIVGQVLNADGGSFHPDCFACDTCQQRITAKFSKMDGKRICANCVPKNKCEGCGEDIPGAATKVDDKFFHPECFKCAGCEKLLSSSFFRDGPRFMCKECIEKGGAEAGDPESKTKARQVCRACKLPIEGHVVMGDKDDPFHEECFVCARCGEKLETFIIDEHHRFKYQERRYVCGPCGEKELEERQTKRGSAEKRPCIICKEPCVVEDQAMHLLDGGVLHWSCFKCCGCGEQEKVYGDHTVMRLLRTKVEALREGTYFCKACITKQQPASEPLPEPKKIVRLLPHGTYVGKGVGAGTPPPQLVYSVKLMSEGQCWVDYTSQTPIATSTWHVEGSYTEERVDGKTKSVAFEVKARPFGGGPEPGSVLELAVEPGDTHEVLVIEGVKCVLQIGVPEYEIQEMMRPKPAPAPAPEPAPAPAAAKTEPEAPSEFLSLEELQNADVWKAKGIDAGKREMFLPDSDFATLFGMGKSDFEALPKWKRDKAKKDHGLF